MTIEVYTTREDWVRVRTKKDLSASSAAEELFGIRPSYRTSTVGGSRGDAMRAGRLLEPGVALALHELRPAWRLEKNVRYFRSVELRLGGIPDYFVGADGVVEIVTVGEKEWAGTPPVHKLYQAAVYRIVSERPRVFVAVMVRDAGYHLALHVYEVKVDDGVVATITDAASALWRAWGAGVNYTPSVPSVAWEYREVGSTGIEPAKLSAAPRRPVMPNPLGWPVFRGVM